MASIAASARRATRCAFRAPARANVAALRGLATFQLGRLNHVALAVPDIEQASAMWRDALGASCGLRCADAAPLSDGAARRSAGLLAATTSKGDTPLHLGSLNAHVETLRLLLLADDDCLGTDVCL